MERLGPFNKEDITGELSLGVGHSCFRSVGGKVRCWGEGDDGRLGYGNEADIGDGETPASAGDVNVGGTVVQISAGGGHTCALLNTGKVRCWGRCDYGQLGYGNENDIGDGETPASAGDVNVGGTVVQISAGSQHTCALLNTGKVRCWGYGEYGQLGYGNENDIGDDNGETPASAGDVNVGGTVTQISAGYFHTCALLNTGKVRCWGRCDYGQLGYGNENDIGDDETPADAGDVNVGGTVVQVNGGYYHTCALLNTGKVRCWGSGSIGQLGYGNETDIGDNETPADAGDVNVGGTVTQISAGAWHTCALLNTGKVRCWGRCDYGQLGYVNQLRIGDDEDPASAGDVNVGGTVVQISAGYLHTCALLNTGKVRCWGAGEYGRLGYGNADDIGDDETPASAGDVNIGL